MFEMSRDRRVETGLRRSSLRIVDFTADKRKPKHQSEGDDHVAETISGDLSASTVASA
jgi:hypothetical protein